MSNKEKKTKPVIRKIIHVDMDAFFASVEQRDFPQYRNKPVAVGSPQKRGVVAAASYEARKYGVYSAMPSTRALFKCPDLIFAKPRFHVYKEVSTQINKIFREYTDLVEPLSLDEAYLDVTLNKKNMISATHIAQEIKEKIKSYTRLTASAGISVNKFLAKIASDMDKPDGLYVITPNKVHAFIQTLPIEKFFGVGKVTAKKMKGLGISTGADLLKKDIKELLDHFGKNGLYYYNIVRGNDNRPVQPSRVRKSIGAENTFQEDIVDESRLILYTEKIADEVWKRMSKSDTTGKTITLKVKYHDFLLNTHSTTLSQNLESIEELKIISKKLLAIRKFPDKAIRLLGISISNLNNGSTETGGVQLTLKF